MDNSCKTAMAASVAGGYLLGRTKKAKLALGIAMFLSGRRLKLAPADLAAAGMRQLSDNPQLAGLRDQVRDELFGAVKTAASAAMDRQVSTLTDSLRERTAPPAAGGKKEGSGDEAPEDADENEQEPEQQEDDEAEATEEPSRRKSAQSRGGGKDSGGGPARETKRSQAKHAPAKRTPAKRPAAKRSGSGSADAQHARSTRSGR